MTKQTNPNFKNLTKNVLDQKDTNLCVPISVTTLLRWAIKKDLKIWNGPLNEHYSFEKIFTLLTMVIYPRSLAGLNLNSNEDEKEFQHNEIEVLLKRLKLETYLNPCGWDIIKESLGPIEIPQKVKNSFCSYEEGIEVFYEIK